MTKRYVNSKILFRTLLTLSLASALGACGPQKLSYTQSLNPNDIAAEPPAKPLPLPDMKDLELVTTYQKQVLDQETLAQYEQQEKQIQTSQALIHLDKVKMSKVTMKYDAVERKLFVQGFAEVLDEDGKKISDSPFQIAGQHNSDQAVLTLKGVAPTKQNSNDRPVVRAKATCIGVDEKDNVVCSSVIIDFFIAYNKKIYTEQMEVKTGYKPAPKTEPKKETPKDEPNLVVTEPKDKEKDKTETKTETEPKAQTETGKDDGTNEDRPSSEVEPSAEEDGLIEEDESLQGRFEGQVKNPELDLTEVFDDDEEILKVIAPSKVKDQKSKDKTDPSKKEKDKVDPKKDPKAADSKDKTVTSDMAITADGNTRPINQAIGVPNNGSLRNATSALLRQQSLKQPYFLIAQPDRKRYFTTYEMAEMLTRMGEKLHVKYQKTLIVGSLSQKRGGKLNPHKSHQIGMDADIAYPTETKSLFPNVVDKKTRTYYPSKISLEKTFDLFKFAFKQKDLKIDRIFVDSKIKKELCEYAKAKGETKGPDKEVVDQMFRSLQHVYGHGDHFHLRLRCTPAHPACRLMVYTKQPGCE